MRWLLVIIFITQTSCSFVVSAAGSFIGNLGADIAYDKLKEKEKKNELE